MKLPIETDTGREQLRILRITGEGLTARLEGEGIVQPGPGGPPMHIHWKQDEGLRVVEGRLGYEVAGGAAQYVEVGEEVVFPAGVAHRFWNAGEGVLRTEAWISPAGNFPWFITRMHASIRENGGGRPGLFDMAFLVTRYSSEFDMLAIPKPVKRFVLPAVVVLGRVLGRYRKYADAPQPI